MILSFVLIVHGNNSGFLTFFVFSSNQTRAQIFLGKVIQYCKVQARERSGTDIVIYFENGKSMSGPAKNFRQEKNIIKCLRKNWWRCENIGEIFLCRVLRALYG